MPLPGDPLLLCSGAALCALATWRGAGGALRWAGERRLRRQQSDADARAFRDEVRAALDTHRARRAKGLAWEGWRPLRVAAVVDEAPAVKSFYLIDPDGRTLPAFLPGQYLTLAAPVVAGAPPIVRCYSLSDRPRGDYYRLTVKRQGAWEGAPAGRVSNWLHDTVTAGSTLSVGAPSGAFFLDPTSERPVALLGAGVGVTPLVSMLADVHHTRTPREVVALLGFRDGERVLFRESIAALREEPQEKLRAVVALSRPRDEDRPVVDYQLSGRLSIDLVRRALPSNNYDFYLCGPAEMMQTLVPDLLEWGVPAEAIHYEAFGPSSVAAPESSDVTRRAVGSEVRFQDDEEAIVWDGAYRTLLDLAEARGVPIASGCRAGNCGACRVRVREGSIATLRRPGAQLGEGECLACISLPDGPVLLEA